MGRRPVDRRPCRDDRCRGPGPRRAQASGNDPRNGFDLGAAFDSIWMMSDGRLACVNAVDNSVVDIALPLGDGAAALPDIEKYCGIAVGEGAIWIADLGDSVIYKVDPQANALALTIPTDIFGSVGTSASARAPCGSSPSTTTTRRSRATTQSGAVEAKIALPEPGKGVAVGAGTVWVTAAKQAELYRIDPKTNQIVDDRPARQRRHHRGRQRLDLERLRAGRRRPAHRPPHRDGDSHHRDGRPRHGKRRRCRHGWRLRLDHHALVATRPHRPEDQPR